jgi:hypothetical protein
MCWVAPRRDSGGGVLSLAVVVVRHPRWCGGWQWGWQLLVSRLRWWCLVTGGGGGVGSVDGGGDLPSSPSSCPSISVVVGLSLRCYCRGCWWWCCVVPVVVVGVGGVGAAAAATGVGISNKRGGRGGRGVRTVVVVVAVRRYLWWCWVGLVNL